METSWRSSSFSFCTDFVSILAQNRNRIFTPYCVWFKGVRTNPQHLRIAWTERLNRFSAPGKFTRFFRLYDSALHLLTFRWLNRIYKPNCQYSQTRITASKFQNLCANLAPVNSWFEYANIRVRNIKRMSIQYYQMAYLIVSQHIANMYSYFKTRGL